MRRFRTFLASKKIFFTFLLLLTFVLGCTSDKGGAIKTKVERKDLVQRVTVSGTIVAAKQTIIQVTYEGYVEKLFVEIGQKVKKDQPLVTVVQSLASQEQGFPLRAPYDGVVTQILKKEGEYVPGGNSTSVDSGNRLMRFDDLSSLFVEVNIPEIDVGKIKIGQTAKLRTSALLDQSFEGTVKEIALASKEQDRWNRGQVEFAARIQINNPSVQLKPGLTAMVDIIVEKKEAVLVLPHQYVQREGDQSFVTTVKGQRKDIKVGLRNDEYFEITDGLNDGEEVRQVDYVELMLKEKPS